MWWSSRWRFATRPGVCPVTPSRRRGRVSDESSTDCSDRTDPSPMTSAHVLVARTTDFSFPGDHATAVGAVAVGLLLTRRRLGIVMAAFAVLMAFARVYVGAHYPGDVVAGLALGGVTAFVVNRA